MKKIIFEAFTTFLCLTTFSQDSAKVQMFGKVLDVNNKPVKNVTVILKGTDLNTTTNWDGTYFFMLPARKGMIVYYHEGYAKKEIAFTGTPQANDILLSKKN
jgi:hypothetical protein